MIAKLERRLSSVLQNKDQTQKTHTMGATRPQGGGGGGMGAGVVEYITRQIFALDSAVGKMQKKIFGFPVVLRYSETCLK